MYDAGNENEGDDVGEDRGDARGDARGECPSILPLLLVRIGRANKIISKNNYISDGYALFQKFNHIK